MLKQEAKLGGEPPNGEEVWNLGLLISILDFEKIEASFLPSQGKKTSATEQATKDQTRWKHTSPLLTHRIIELQVTICVYVLFSYPGAISDRPLVKLLTDNLFKGKIMRYEMNMN